MFTRDHCKDFGNRLSRAIGETVKKFLIENGNETETLKAIEKIILTTEITGSKTGKGNCLEISQQTRVKTRIEDTGDTNENEEDDTSEFEKDLSKMIKNLIEKYGNE